MSTYIKLTRDLPNLARDRRRTDIRAETTFKAGTRFERVTQEIETRVAGQTFTTTVDHYFYGNTKMARCLPTERGDWCEEDSSDEAFALELRDAVSGQWCELIEVMLAEGLTTRDQLTTARDALFAKWDAEEESNQ